MPLLPRSLLELTDPDGRQEIVRVLHLVPGPDQVHVICVDRSDAMPEVRGLREMEEGLAKGTSRLLTADPFASLQRPEDAIPEKHRCRRDQAWRKIEPIVTAPDGAAFDPTSRGRLVRQAIELAGGTKKHIYRYLRRYWQGGMTRNALLPHFEFSGGPGKDRKPGNAKRGCPRLLTRLKGAPPGINIGPDEADKLRRGYRTFYAKTSENGGLSFVSAYRQTLQKFFKAGLEFRGGIMVPQLPPSDQLPSLGQFRYWATKGNNLSESLLRRYGERKFNLKLRPVLGDSTLMGHGPGSLVQIDSTPSDICCVSGLDRSRRLGRPTVFFVVDTFSHLIVGFYAGLENPSVLPAGLALQNATVDKVSFCTQFGITIDSEDWPSSGLPERILADRGELEGRAASNIVHSLDIQVANASPYRADMKGIVERTFRSMNDLLIHSLPGAIRKPKERGERDPQLEAALTLGEFRTLLIHAILQQNGRRIESYRLQPDMIADHLEPRPKDLWAWGIAHRSGHLRQVDPEIVRANLLPGGSATVTCRGIKFRGLFYSTARAQNEGWYVRARSSNTWRVEVAFDPRCVDHILLRMPPGSKLEEGDLVEADRRFAGMSWEDVEDFALSQNEDRHRAKTADLQSRVNHDTEVAAIVGRAVEKAEAANRHLTKAARLRDVRENRKAARQQDWAQTANSDAVAESPVPEPERDNDYVPPPSPLDMLRNQRKSQLEEQDE